MRKKLILVATLILPCIILVSLPFGLNQGQSILFAAVLLVVSWWATGAVNRNIASLFLLVVFLTFGNTPLSTVFKFPLSANFFLIVFAFLISEGIKKSNLADRISIGIIERFGYTSRRLVLLSFVLGFVLIFFIPQPFPRVILVSTIYIQFLKKQDINKETWQTILFSIYVASTCTSMSLLNGDILLNYMALRVGGVTLNFGQWAFYMAVPSFIISILMYVLFIVIFKNNISDIKLGKIENENVSKSLSTKEKKALIILISVLVLWMSEPFHSINSAWVSFLGAAAMYLCNLIEIRDIKKINVNLLLFLTAAFSIGGVLNNSGVAKLIFSKMATYLPNPGSIVYYSFIILIVMILHLFLGSSVTTISVGLPGLLSINGANINPIVIILIVYTTVSVQYLLPFHHATIMIGAGENHYSNSYVLKYGIALTFLIFISIIFIEIPWWRFINLF